MPFSSFQSNLVYLFQLHCPASRFFTLPLFSSAAENKGKGLRKKPRGHFFIRFLHNAAMKMPLPPLSSGLVVPWLWLALTITWADFMYKVKFEKKKGILKPMSLSSNGKLEKREKRETGELMWLCHLSLIIFQRKLMFQQSYKTNDDAYHHHHRPSAIRMWRLNAHTFIFLTKRSSKKTTGIGRKKALLHNFPFFPGFSYLSTSLPHAVFIFRVTSPATGDRSILFAFRYFFYFWLRYQTPFSKQPSTRSNVL